MYTSRPIRRSAEYGFRPATGSVVDFWKNSGTISTSPPKEMTSKTRPISSQGFFSIHSCENFTCASSDRVNRIDAGNAWVDRDGAAQGLQGVVGHHQHAGQVQQAAAETDHVIRVGGLDAFD